MVTRPTTPKHKMLSFEQWNTATNVQRQTWLDSGYVLRIEDLPALHRHMEAVKRGEA